MKKMKIWFIILSIICYGCADKFLDLKPAKNLVILSTIKDFESLIDRVSVFNEKGSQSLALLSSDDYFLTENSWKTMSSAFQRNAYVWNTEIFEGTQSADWDNGYERIFSANLAIEGLNKIKPSSNDQQYWNNVMGRALFHRAWNHFNLLVLFGEYGAVLGENNKRKGIPLRKESDITIPVTRESVAAAYDIIVNDLLKAEKLFDEQQFNIERPTKRSVLALLARVFIYMQDYEKAYHYADLCIKSSGELIDYNDLDASKSYPFPAYGVGNKEILFNSWQPSITALAENRLCIDTALMTLYHQKDCRLALFFKENGSGYKAFKGSYVGNLFLFSGISLNEVYLIGMESATRIDKLDEALLLYNALRKKRIVTDSYSQQMMVPKAQLLELVIDEKRRELVMRSNRWEDLKRFNNTDGAFMVLTRKLGLSTFNLNPFDKKYNLPIPDYVIKLSEIEQNQR